MSPGHLALGTRLRKLRAMSIPEVAHRLTYATTLRSERRAHRAGRLLGADRLRTALGVPGSDAGWRAGLVRARREHPAPFFASVGQRDEIRALFASRFQDELAAVGTESAKVKAGTFEFFGRTFTYPEGIDWQADPVSGRRWPSLYHADVPVHRGDVGFGDVKHVWELSRQQFVVDLGKAWFLTGDRDSLTTLQSLVRSWIAGNPYATGVNWSCALEPAFRVFSWLWAYHLTVDAIDDDFHVEWLEALLDHGNFIERHLERYSSPYNHLMAEAAALYALAATLPELADAPRWRRTALDVLVQRLPQQFYADGGSVEQSTFYHHATVGFYLFAALIGRAAGDELPQVVWTAIERGLDFSLALSQPDGFTPPIGGADDGKPIRMEHLPFWDFRPYLAMGAVLFGRSDFKAMAGRFYEDALWMLGTAGLRAFDAMPGTPPAALMSALPHSGYFVMRSAWDRGASYACFDCGEQAAGMRPDAVPNSMHGHADCLSLSVWLSGQRVLVDSGLFGYNVGGEWESHFRRTAAHNTALIDGRDQATHLGKMAWSHSYAARQEGWASGEWGSWVAGSHDGYLRGPAGVRHRRSVWLRPAGYLVVLDEFEGEGSHDVDVNWQFAPGVLGQTGPRSASYGQSVSVTVLATCPISLSTASGGDAPGDGWIAPSLGVRVAAPRLTVHGKIAGPLTRLLTIVAHEAAVRPAASPDAASGVVTPLVASVRGRGWTDVVAAAAAAPGLGAGSPIETRAALAIGHVGDEAAPVAWALHGEACTIDPVALTRLTSAST